VPPSPRAEGVAIESTLEAGTEPPAAGSLVEVPVGAVEVPPAFEEKEAGLLQLEVSSIFSCSPSISRRSRSSSPISSLSRCRRLSPTLRPSRRSSCGRRWRLGGAVRGRHRRRQAWRRRASRHAPHPRPRGRSKSGRPQWLRRHWSPTTLIKGAGGLARRAGPPEAARRSRPLLVVIPPPGGADRGGHPGQPPSP
jgi:hypothetical protein